ncbi:NmrA-domain-containing protein [Meredithblackwellia eburnea MCA 4105]
MVATSSQKAPLVVVVGSTGAQGGSVINHLISSTKEYRLRGITRDPTKSNATALVERGVEVVKGDLASRESLESAFKGATYVFGVTNFWETMDPEKEVRDGKLLVDVAKEAGVKLFIWSGLEPVTQVSNGKYTKVGHFDSKAKVTEYLKASGLPYSNVQPGFYLSNFSTMMVPRKGEDGTYTLALPVKASAQVPVLDAQRDYGAYVVEAIESPSFGAGSEVLAAKEYISFADIVAKWSEVSGKTIKHQELPDEVMVKLVPHGGEELVEMLRFFQDFGYFGGKDIAPSQKDLGSETWGFEQWARSVDWNKVLAA